MSSGFTTSDYINTPPFIVEDLIREHIKVELNVQVDSVNVPSQTVVISNAASDVDDYYQGAFLVYPAGNWIKEVTDYVGSTKTFTLDPLTSTLEFSTGDYYYLTNINPNINTDSVDSVGNSSTGTRRNWLFRFSQVDEIQSLDLLNELCYFGFMYLGKNGLEWELSDLDIHTPSVTLDTPQYKGTVPQVGVTFTSSDNIFTDFELLYNYNYATQEYENRDYVCKDSTTNSTLLGSSYQSKCETAQTDILKGARKKLTIESKYFNSSTTAAYFLQKIIAWHTKLYMRLDFLGDIKNHISLQPGDRVYTDLDKVIPTGYAGLNSFIIERKKIITAKGKWGVRLQCLELPF